jgi:hypothetical protein
MNANAAKLANLTAILFLTSVHAPTVRAEDNRLAPIQVEASFDVDCRTPRVPGQQDIARLFDVANLGQAYELRIRLQHVALRACHSGADRVRFALQPRSPDAALRYVALQD